MKTDNDFNEAYDALAKSGWLWLGCDEWRDPVTNEKHMTSTAYKVMVQRAKATVKAERRKPRQPRLIHWQDWMGIAQELRRQLKPFGLTIKTRGHMLRNGDFIRWTVSKTS